MSGKIAIFCMLLHGAYIPCLYVCVCGFVDNHVEDIFPGCNVGSGSQIARVVQLNL